MKKSILAPIVALGLIAGFTAASIFWPVPSRGERIATLFKSYCLPHHRGEDVTAKASADLVPHAHTASSTQWIDQASASFLQLATRRCQVTTTHPFALSALDAKELLDLIAPIVAQEFPELPIDPKATMGPDSISKGWLLGKAQSPERWGVFFSAYPDWGASAGSILFLASPTQ